VSILINYEMALKTTVYAEFTCTTLCIEKIIFAAGGVGTMRIAMRVCSQEASPSVRR
jgi:hypothetical protein